MKITKSQLRQIIKEEVSKVLNETRTPMEILKDTMKYIQDNKMTPYWAERADEIASSADLTYEKVNDFNDEVKSQEGQDQEYDPYFG